MEFILNTKRTIVLTIGWLIRWMILLLLSRILFLLSNFHLSSQQSIFEISNSLFYGAYIDFSLTGYLTMIFILIMIAGTFRFNDLKKFVNSTTIVLIIIVALMCAINNVLYKDWGFPLDNSILRYVSNPGEVKNFIHLHTFLKFLFNFLSIALVGGWIFRNFINKIQGTSISQLAAWISLLFLMVIPARGGLGLATMRPGTVYFSHKMYLNHTAINPVWNFIYSMLEYDNFKNQYIFFQDDEANEIVNGLRNECMALGQKFITTENPNILFIILESFSAGLIDHKYKGIPITPHLNQWSRKSVYFPNTYASGDRTDKGIVSIFSGYPAQPRNSIMNLHDKCENLPSIIESGAGYDSYFYYGGDADFAGMESYLLSAGMGTILDKDNFSSNEFNAKWGVHDHVLFNRFINDIESLNQPFISAILTLSSHPPYDIPVPAVWNETKEEVLFYNSVHYTDEALGMFLDALKKEEIWKNLVVCITADHGARYPGNHENHESEKFRIPLLFTGGAITESLTNPKLISQIDIPFTLSKQLGWESNKFSFSCDIFSEKAQHCVYFAFNNGIGWINDKCEEIYSLDTNSDIVRIGKCDEEQKQMKAFLQVLMKDYQNR